MFAIPWHLLDTLLHCETNASQFFALLLLQMHGQFGGLKFFSTVFQLCKAGEKLNMKDSEQ